VDTRVYSARTVLRVELARLVRQTVVVRVTGLRQTAFHHTLQTIIHLERACQSVDHLLSFAALPLHTYVHQQRIVYGHSTVRITRTNDLESMISKIRLLVFLQISAFVQLAYFPWIQYKLGLITRVVPNSDFNILTNMSFRFLDSTALLSAITMVGILL